VERFGTPWSGTDHVQKKAAETLDLEVYRASMAGIYSTSVSEQTLDEAPMAYKALEDNIDVIWDTVDVLDVMKPVYNFKAG
jgi:RNA-splicing ligase RtcB